MIYHVKCYETVNFTVAIDADSVEQAEELALEDINSHEVISESVTAVSYTHLTLPTNREV